MPERNFRLIMVYNADSGMLNMLKDGLHKLIRPQTYPCSLCALTYGPVMMRGKWRRFLENLGGTTIFLYRDTFRQDHHARDLPLPAILLARGPGQPEILISAEELDAMPDLHALIALVEARLGF
jgi:hypothetical protein